MANIPPVPGTTPQDWIELVNLAINTQLPINVDLHALDITNTQQLIEFMQANNWEPVYRMSEIIVGWAQVSGANPAETTAVAVRPATDLILAGGAGTAASELVAGRGAFGMVKKSIIATTCMTIFVSSLTPLGTQEQADYKQAIIDAITPFTIDGENVPVYVDDEGKTYLSETLMNAVRQALINLGTYNTGTEEITIPEGVTPRFVWDTPIPLYTYSDGVIISGNMKNNGAPDVYNFTRYTFHDITHTEPIYYGIILHQRSENNWVPAPFLISRAQFSGKVDWYRIRNDGYISDLTNRNVSSSRESWSGNVYYVDTPGSAFGDNFTSKQNAISFVNANVNPAVSDSIVSSMYNVLADYFYLIDNGTIGGGEGVPGVDVTGKSDFGNMSITLDTAIQGLADRARQILNPTDEDLTNKDTWYPANLNADDIFTDGLPSDKTDPDTNTQGDPDDASKDDLIDSLLDLIRDITGNPDLPDIPAGDSGDTPPAEPPVLNGSSNGLWTMYNPTKQQVNDFGAWLWSDTLIDQIIRQFNSPIDAVIGFHQIYCTPITGSQKIIKAGYLDSPVSAAEVTNQYADIDCGQVSVNEYYQNALDYDNTQVSLFLPFVGIVPLNTNVVMGSVLQVIYRIDVFTGTCLAQVKVIKENSNAVMYAFEGNCAVQIPLTGTTYTGMVGALLGGLSASVSFMAGDMYHGVSSALGAITAAGSGLTGVKQSGNMGANAGSLGIRIPYLIITRSASAMPAGFEGLRGIPSTELVTLGSVSGFTSVRDIHLEGIPATAEEINEIRELLSEGVIL